MDSVQDYHSEHTDYTGFNNDGLDAYFDLFDLSDPKMTDSVVYKRNKTVG